MMELNKLTSRENQYDLRQCGPREEGELSDDDHDEDITSSKTERNYSRSNFRGESPYSSHRHGNQNHRYSSFDKERHIRSPIYSRYGKHGGRKRSYGFEHREDELRRSVRQTSHSNSNTPSSKIWENRRFRASSVRPRTPPVKTNVRENQDELLELVKEQERIRQQLQSLEEEERKDIIDLDRDDKNASSEDEYILDIIEKFPDRQLGDQSVPVSPKQGSVHPECQLLPLGPSDGKAIESSPVEMEDISDEEDFDEQKLRILALATSARHNQLLAKGIQNDSTTIKSRAPPAEPPGKEEEPIVVVPDVESEMQEPVVVVVPEDEENVKELTKDVSAKKGVKAKAKSSPSKESKSKEKSRSKRKRKGSGKQNTKKKSPSQKGKVTREWAKQRKVLKALALDDPTQAIEKIMKLAKDGKLHAKPAPPKLTGTMGDFKRQKHLPLLSKSQQQAMVDKQVKVQTPQPTHKKGKEKKGAELLQDNYEEVEMEITSDCEEKETPKLNGDPALKRLKLGSDFTQAMQPIPMMRYTPCQMNSGSLPLMTSAFPIPQIPLPSSSMENLSSSLAVAPPLPHNPPPHQPPPPPLPPPPPPPLPLGSSSMQGASSSSNITETATCTDTFYAYSNVNLEQRALELQGYQSVPEKMHDFSSRMDPLVYSYPSPSKPVFIPSMTEISLELSDQSSKPLSIDDIGSQLHRIRKEQEWVRKCGSDYGEESLPHSHSKAIDISQGFWSKEEHEEYEPRALQSLLSPRSRAKDYRCASHKDSDCSDSDRLHSQEIIEYHPSPKVPTLASIEQRDVYSPSSPTILSSSSLSVSPNERHPVRRTPSLHLEDVADALDTEKENSDDEDELRKQLLSSLALKRVSFGISEIIKQKSPESATKSKETERYDDTVIESIESDEEPVPPPVVKRVWIDSPSAADGVDSGQLGVELSPQQIEDDSTKNVHKLDSGATGEGIHGDKMTPVEPGSKDETERGSDNNSIIPAPPSDFVNSVSESDSKVRSLAPEISHDPDSPAIATSTSDNSLVSSSRPLVSFRVKPSLTQIQSLKMDVQLPAVSLSSGTSSPLRAQSPTTSAVSGSSKSLSSNSSSVIKTIYFSSQCLPSSNSTSSNIAASGPNGKSKRIVDHIMVSHRTLSPSIPSEDGAGGLLNSSSALDTRDLVARHPKKYSNIEVPIHPSVIIPLHPSSDEEEEEATRSSSDENFTSSGSQASKLDLKKLVTEEKFLLAQKKSIVADQERLRNLLSKAGDALKAQRQAEATRESLQAQIAALMERERAVSRMAKVQEQLKDGIKRKARDVKDRLLKSKPLFIEKTKSVMALGRTVVGPNFIPKALRAKHQGSKSKAGSEQRQALTKSQKIAIEKMKLREKEQEIAEKLKVLKESTNSGRQNKRKRPSAFIQEKPSDVIHLGQENVDVALPQKRRKSLLSDHSSKTPNLPMTPKLVKSKTQPNVSQNDANVEEGQGDAHAFQMPKGSQLSHLRKILVEEKVEKVLRNTKEHIETTGTDLYSAFHRLGKMEDLSVSLVDDKRSNKMHEKALVPVSRAYSSPLKMLRSYRFSKFYRTKEALSLTSKTSCHKINPDCVMCPYDLQGTCNDDHCRQQHPKDYELSHREVLEDLVSFHPQVTGIKPRAPRESIKKAVGSYVDSFLAKHKDRLTLEEMCLLITSEVIKVAGYGQAVCTIARRWKPEAKEEKGLTVHLEHNQAFKNLQLLDLEKYRPMDKDVLIGEEDIRYFISEGTDTLSLEEAVLGNPQDINLWLQLSARRMADPIKTPRECLDEALNVLARALEANRSNPDLWLQYLTLYQKHAEVKDFPQFCQTALEYAPSYELWFMYLNSLRKYHEKERACLKALDFLCQNSNSKQNTDGIKDDKSSTLTNGVGELQKPNHNAPVSPLSKCGGDKMSHQVLELIVYYTNLNFLSGHFKKAIKFLQSVLEIKGTNTTNSIYSGNKLSVRHTLVLWMIYIHVLEWRHLPKDVFLGGNGNPGRIVTEKFSLPWSSKPQLYTPLKTLVNLHWTAAKVWTSTKDKEKEKEEAEEPFVWLMQSLVSLLFNQQCPDEALSVCHNVLADYNLVDIWLTTASVYAAKKDVDGAYRVFREAFHKNMYSAKLQFYQSVFLCSQDKGEEALHSLEQFIISCFEEPSSQSLFGLDPNLLFCQLLNLQEGFSLQMTCKPKPQVASNPTKDVFIWMCYCQLLELQGETTDAVEIFERSLTHVQSPSDLILVWQSYISFLLRSNNKSSKSSSPSSMQDLLIRSIISTPMKLPLPFSPTGASVVDFRYSNQIVEVWLGLLPSEQRLDVVEKCLNHMPGNVPLLLRGLELCILAKETRRAFCWCKMMAAQSEQPTCLAFWKTAYALAYTEGMHKEVEHMLIRWAQAMPLAVSAWKDLLLFEVTREDSEIVSQVLSQCRQLGLNIQDYVQTLSAKVTTSNNSVA